MRIHRIVQRAALFLACLVTATTRGDLAIYSDALQNAWVSWSWGTTVDFAASNQPRAGTSAVAATINQAWGALFLHHDAMDIAGYTNLSFWVRGNGQRVVVQAVMGGSALASGQTIGPLASTWQRVNVPMTALVPPGQAQIDGIWFQDTTGGAQAVFYLDDLVLQSGAAAPPGTNATVNISVDAGADVHPINPLIYGVAFASSNELTLLNAPLNRSGGNSTTRYNWLTNASNRASDWYFESLISELGSVPGGDGDALIRASKAAGAEPMLTIPTIGWVAKLGPNSQRLSSYSIAKYGAQTGSDSQWFPDAGNGIRTSNGSSITNNDPNDANLPAGTNFQAGWVQHLTNLWGRASNGGLRYYIMDNEWSLWHETHRDVHPVGATMEEVRDKFCDYAEMVKRQDPEALVAGPEEWGWSGYLYSGYDLQWGSQHGWSGTLPDRAAHGGKDFVPWWLDQVRQRSQAAGRRLLDVFTLHVYPQGGEFSNDASTAMQLRRNRSTRALWDPNYVDETWIADKVMLIPRMKQWVTNYPGTRLGITEYNWGAEGHINGATAQADVYGIFGREGLDLATRWTTPAANSPTFKAMQMYRNYDGQKSGFGSMSVRASVPNPDNLSAFAAVRTNDGALTVMLINKVLANSTPAVIALNDFSHAGTAQVWQLSASNFITRLSNAVISGSTLSASLPPQSITLLVLPVRPQLRLARSTAGGQLVLSLQSVSAQSYRFDWSTNLTHWLPFSTNTATSNLLTVSVDGNTPAQRYFRVSVTP